MSAEKSPNEFEPLPIRKRAIANTDPNQYIIFDASGIPREIKANTAYEAFRASGAGRVRKIERRFIFNKNVLAKSILVDDSATAGRVKAGSPEELHEKLHRRKSPIVSADELDELMRTVQEIQSQGAEPVAPAQAAEPALMTQTVAPQEQLPQEQLVVPPPPPEALPAGAPSPVGMDVHGDGFDEIIPSGVPAKPPAPLKHAEPKEEAPSAPQQSAPAAELPPERELSPEEVEKLLGSKPE